MHISDKERLAGQDDGHNCTSLECMMNLKRRAQGTTKHVLLHGRKPMNTKTSMPRLHHQLMAFAYK
eukprot:1161214-Pelagomonas_calceolata.AAC.5